METEDAESCFDLVALHEVSQSLEVSDLARFGEGHY